MRYKGSVYKTFGYGQNVVTEKVAKQSILKTSSGYNYEELNNMFTLRIDADEYTPESFREYYDLFSKFSKAITIFFSVNSFKTVPEEIHKCKDLGVDVQSHGYYHYTYKDFSSNRYNIWKAKQFFSNIGVDTIGFAAPSGKWNMNLMKALESEGYRYSSDFSYDYLNFPTKPSLIGVQSNILEIPIFPVAPELFYQDTKATDEDIFDFYKKAVDNICLSGLPVIVYGHTSVEYPEVPKLLERIVDYALNVKKLEAKNMTDIFYLCESAKECKLDKSVWQAFEDCFIGKEKRLKIFTRIKEAIKNAVEYERVTPISELRCRAYLKVLKIIFRKISG